MSKASVARKAANPQALRSAISAHDLPTTAALFRIEDRLLWIGGKLRVLLVVADAIEDEKDGDMRAWLLAVLRDVLTARVDEIQALRDVPGKARLGTFTQAVA